MMRDAIFSAISDPTRRQILSLLRDTPSAVESLAAQFPVSRPAISKHLAALVKSGLVSRQSVGRQNIYALNVEPLLAVRDWLDEFWGDRLTIMKRLAEGDS